MKKFALVALLLSLGLLATACNKTETKKTPEAAPPADTKMDGAAAPADAGAPAEPAK
jgi:hypothetical protein